MIKSKPISKNQPVNTVIGVMKGPIKGRNWFTTTTNPAYTITQSQFTDASNTGVVKLQGTNDVALRNSDMTSFTSDLLPSETASWTDIETNGSTVSNTFTTEFKFLRLIISTQGTGYVMNAFVFWQ